MRATFRKFLAVAYNYADRIRCAFDVVGISNLKTFLEHTESYRRDLRRAEYGDERDPKMAEFMERIAPLNNAAKITKPLFVVAGANDPRVPKSEGDQIVDTLKKQGVPVWHLIAKDEGHGSAKKKNADFQFYASVQFIREYLHPNERKDAPGPEQSAKVLHSTTVFRNGQETNEHFDLHQSFREQNDVHFGIGFHDRDWWLRSYSILLMGGCYFYLADDGCWYPARGFDPRCYYPIGVVYCE